MRDQQFRKSHFEEKEGGVEQNGRGNIDMCQTKG